jgi:hypothetical protein
LFSALLAPAANGAVPAAPLPALRQVREAPELRQRFDDPSALEFAAGAALRGD